MRARSFVPGLAGVAALAAAALVLPAGGAAHHDHPDSWWNPPRDVRAMLEDISAKNLQKRRPRAGRLRHAPHAVDADRPEARDRRRARLDQVAVRRRRRDVRRAHDRRASTRSSSRCPPASRRRRGSPTSSRRCTGTDPSRPTACYVVCAHYDSRVTDVLERDRRRARRQRRRVRVLGAVLELARVLRRAPDGGDDRVRHLRGRGAGPVRLQPLRRRSPQTSSWNIQGVPQHGHHRQLAGRQRRRATGTNPALLRGRADRETHGADRDTARRSAARTTASRASSPATSRRRARTRRPTWASSCVWRRDRYLRSGDQVSFLQRGWAAVRFTEPNENFDHEHQDVRVENGTQFGDLPQFVDFQFLARVTRVVGSSAGGAGPLAAARR